MTRRTIRVEINGEVYERSIDPRMLLSDFIRHEAHLTGTHVGCEHGICGACTIQLDGEPVRSCTMLAVQAEEHRVRTVEALEWHPLQQAFHEAHGLQCGFCTPGFLMTLEPLVERGEELDPDRIREEISGNLCRCTGYQQIVDAVQIAIKRYGADGEGDQHASKRRDANQRVGDARLPRRPKG